MGKKAQIGSHGHVESASASGTIIATPPLCWWILCTKTNDVIISPTDTGTSKLSTFTSKANVQMRRTTNKKGKTAPAPPKRTRLALCSVHLIHLQYKLFTLSNDNSVILFDCILVYCQRTVIQPIVTTIREQWTISTQMVLVQ